MAFNGIIFMETWRELEELRHSWRAVHILCEQGCMTFAFHGARYDIAAHDYVIMPHAAVASDFAASADFRGTMMSLDDGYVASIAMRSNYGVVGHLSLLRNPVMRLSEKDYRVCRDALHNLRERLADTRHLFHEELLGSLLTAHILDLYDIHARTAEALPVSERVAQLLQQFMAMLYRGDYVVHRNLQHYADALCITPHYLAEICKKVSGEPPTYWIDRFTTYEIVRLLQETQLPLSAIAERLHFSSPSYFSRYVQQRLGFPPSMYRR